VRFVAAQAPPPHRRAVRGMTWRRAVFVAVPVALAAVLAAVFIPRDENTGTRPADATELSRVAGSAPAPSAAQSRQADAAAAPEPGSVTSPYSLEASGVPAASDSRLERYEAELTLRVKNANAVSSQAQEALRIAAALGGHPQKVQIDAGGKDGSAYLVLRVPRERVQKAVERLSALGTIVGANVNIQDLQAGVDTTGRLIARLQKRLAELRTQPRTDETERLSAGLAKQIQQKQRARAATIRSASFATVDLRLQTPPRQQPAAKDGDGPLHGLGVAFRWAAIGAVYALALGTPLLALVTLMWFAARGVRRRREEALLSSR
jgi:hypothetical protein